MRAKSMYEYFRGLSERYRIEPSKKQRGLLVNEACLTTGLHRKSVIRALSKIIDDVAPVPRPGRLRRYSEACGFVLRKLYRESDSKVQASFAQ